MGTQFNRSCPHCGRRWFVPAAQSTNVDGQGGWTGFLDQPVENHIGLCEHRTPAQRRLINARDEKKWEKNPPRATITNDPNHPGLVDVEVAAVEEDVWIT